MKAEKIGRSSVDGRPTGSYAETGFEEVAGLVPGSDRMSPDDSIRYYDEPLEHRWSRILQTSSYIFRNQVATALGSKRKQLPILKLGMRPAFANLAAIGLW